MRKLAVAVTAVMLLATFAAGPATARPSFTISYIEAMAMGSTPDYCQARVRVGWTSSGNGWKFVRITWHDVTSSVYWSFDYAPQIKTGTFETNVVFNESANQIPTQHHEWEWYAEMVGGGGKILATRTASPTYQYPTTETCPTGGTVMATYGTVPAG